MQVSTSNPSRLYRRSTPTVVGLAAIALLAAPPAGAHELTVTLTPDHPTWKDRIEVTVEGTVVTPCGPEIVDLVLNETLSKDDLLVLDLREAQCLAGGSPTAYPFSVSAHLQPLTPGLRPIRIRDRSDDTSTLETFTVYDVSPLEMVVPQAARSDEPSVIEVRGWGGCPYGETELVDGVIEGFYQSHCPIQPAGVNVFEIGIPVRRLPAGTYPVHLLDYSHQAFALPSVLAGTLRVWDAEACVPSDTELCLRDGRFRITATWRAFDDSTGEAHAIPLVGRDDTGLLWFFDEENVELTTKVLDACGLNDRYWVFVSSGSTVEYTLTVTDMQSGLSKEYRNDLGETPLLLHDTETFATCP